jgi:hypothetical protein
MRCATCSTRGYAGFTDRSVSARYGLTTTGVPIVDQSQSHLLSARLSPRHSCEPIQQRVRPRECPHRLLPATSVDTNAVIESPILPSDGVPPLMSPTNRTSVSAFSATRMFAMSLAEVDLGRTAHALGDEVSSGNWLANTSPLRYFSMMSTVGTCREFSAIPKSGVFATAGPAARLYTPT